MFALLISSQSTLHRDSVSRVEMSYLSTRHSKRIFERLSILEILQLRDRILFSIFEIFILFGLFIKYPIFWFTIPNISGSFVFVNKLK